MVIDLFDMDEFIELNELQEVKSGVLIQRNNVKHPEGLVSDDIFGVTVKSRKETFAYINLHAKFFHPHVYKALLRLNRNVDRIIDGSLYVSLDKENRLVKDEVSGETGIDFLINNWRKINWGKTDEHNMRNERIELMEAPMNKIFLSKYLVIPAFYRDVQSSSGGGGSRSPLNTLYARLIRLASTLEDTGGMFSFKLHSVNFNIQKTLVEIYDYFQMTIKKKNGMIRKYLMGKNVDFCTREVITAPSFHAARPEDLVTDYTHCGVPIGSILALCQPFILKWLKDFFDREINSRAEGGITAYNGNTKTLVDRVYPDNPEAIYNEKFYLHMINMYVRDPESRFNTFPIPIKDSNTPKYLVFTGKRYDPATHAEDATVNTRPLTWTDVLFLAAMDVTKDKHILVTRYPMVDEYNMFVAYIRVLSTTTTIPMSINGTLYKWYPEIDVNMPKHEIPSVFIDAMQFANAYLTGMNGDYDGDQITAKVIFTKEANEEIDKYINSPSYFINTGGNNVRDTKAECAQTMFVLTKEPTDKNKEVPAAVVKELISCPLSDFTFDKLIDLFGCTTDTTLNKTTKTTPKFRCNDPLVLPAGTLGLPKATSSTIGRLIFNRIVLEDSGALKHIGYVNKVITNKVLGGIDASVSNILKNGDIEPSTLTRYVNCRDWLGYQLHVVVTTSYSPAVIRTPPEVKKLKAELVTKYKKELEAGNCEVSEKIENALIAKSLECFKDDYGLDLFISGARGSLGNNYKNMNLFRGAVKNHATGKYDIITNSLMDGLDKHMIPAHSNNCVTGAYAKSVSTATPGYYSKELAQAMQSEELDPDPESDCGTDKLLEITVGRPSDFEYRYIKENGRLKCLTLDEVGKYAGKTIKMRSPMYCTRTKGGKVCSRCAGQLYYKLDKKNIGLLSTRVASMCTELCMKKFHDATIKVVQIDPDKMFL